MKAIRIHGYGGPEVLQYEDVVVPTPAAGELLIKVQAASINPLDWKTRAGYLKGLFPHTLPFILGWDASGVVEAVGADVTKFKKGDEVYLGLTAMARMQNTRSLPTQKRRLSRNRLTM